MTTLKIIRRGNHTRVLLKMDDGTTAAVTLIGRFTYGQALKDAIKALIAVSPEPKPDAYDLMLQSEQIKQQMAHRFS